MGTASNMTGSGQACLQTHMQTGTHTASFQVDSQIERNRPYQQTC